VQEPLRAYSEREVSSLLGLSTRQLRQCVRDGLLSCHDDRGRDLRFTFEDLVLLRAAKALVDARIPLRRVRTVLRRLRDELPGDMPLSSLRFSAEGGRIQVQDGEVNWLADSGQTLLDFDSRGEPGPAGEPGSAAELGCSDEADVSTPAEAGGETILLWSVPKSARERDLLTAGEWLERGCVLEGHDPAAACEAYRQALALDVETIAAYVNLGRLLHEGGDLRGAEEQYRRALEIEPEEATAAFNLGVVLEDQGLPEEALEAYEHALGCEPSIPDAYHNALRLYERSGDKAGAVRLLKRLRERSS
jgi:tetratricopeptide (TPR) repeat protein